MKYGSHNVDDVIYGGKSVTLMYGENTIFSKKPAKIYGVSWDKGENPTLTRTDDAVGMVANIGIDDEIVTNRFR